MDTIRELIIKEFITRAAVMRNTASPPLYLTNIGEHVIRARKDIDPKTELDACVIWPMAEEAEDKNGMTMHKMPIQVDGLTAFGATDPSVMAEMILGDLIACFASPSWDRRRLVAGSSPAQYLAPLASSIIYQSGGTDEYPEPGSLIVGVFAKFQVVYWTKKGDPFSQ